MRIKQIKYTTVATLLIIVVLFSNCKKQSEPALAEVLMAPLEVGTKTPDYEVISATKLKLSPGVKLRPIKGANGKNNGFILLRANGTLGGYMSCECHSATSGNCKTENDNPEYPSCSGGCTNSEGVPVGCQIVGPIIGPPRSPFTITVVDRKEYEKSILDQYKE